MSTLSKILFQTTGEIFGTGGNGGSSVEVVNPDVKTERFTVPKVNKNRNDINNLRNQVRNLKNEINTIKKHEKDLYKGLRNIKKRIKRDETFFNTSLQDIYTELDYNDSMIQNINNIINNNGDRPSVQDMVTKGSPGMALILWNVNK
jgi:predicted transcriptional regulator